MKQGGEREFREGICDVKQAGTEAVGEVGEVQTGLEILLKPCISLKGAVYEA